jgi:hypothetical protein
MTYLGILKSNALQKSFTETWHSKSKASIQSKRSNVNAKVGFLEVAGQRRNLAKETETASHGQDITESSCLRPTYDINNNSHEVSVLELNLKSVGSVCS